jgi:hypothetical protein
MYKDKLYPGLGDISQNSFYKLFTSKFKAQASPPFTNIDDIFIQYLQDCKDKTNTDYFNFVFKFLILFRECINKTKTDEENEGEFTQIQNAELIPDLCNDFIVDFMEPEDYFGLDTNELIEIIQHLCYWLYVNSYTTSRLTLL